MSEVISDKRKEIRHGNLGYQRLVVWQIADRLAWRVYGITDKFPRDEVYGLTSQLRRAALSVPLNIVEGYARNSKNEFRQFLKVALGSLAETGYLLQFSYKRGYISDKEYNEAFALKEECGRLLWRLMKVQ